MQQSISTLWLISALFFFIELFHFPVYMRKLEAAIQEAEHKTHNYFVAAFLLYLISTLIKMIRRGFLTALCQLLILILSVEAARVILLCYRFIKYRRLTQSQILEQYEYYLPDTVEEDAQAVPGTSQWCLKAHIEALQLSKNYVTWVWQRYETGISFSYGRDHSIMQTLLSSSRYWDSCCHKKRATRRLRSWLRSMKRKMIRHLGRVIFLFFIHFQYFPLLLNVSLWYRYIRNFIL